MGNSIKFIKNKLCKTCNKELYFENFRKCIFHFRTNYLTSQPEIKSFSGTTKLNSPFSFSAIKIIP